MENKVAVAMSGGVDSSVAAFLIQKQYGTAQTHGVYMRTWHSKDALHPLSDCPWHRDSEDARSVAKDLGIIFDVANMIDYYRKYVVTPLVDGYRQGITPNPDILCNQFIKFGVLLEWAKRNGCLSLATGHYCKRRENLDGTVDIVVPQDKNKDQTYFLAYLRQNQIHSALFPLGDLTKKEVREIARQYNFVTAQKKDSQGICFLGKVKIQDFLSQFIKNFPGNIVNSDGKVVGYHQGLHRFTIGQRHGLNIPSNSDHNFYVVTGKNLETNELYVAFESERKLYSRCYKIHNLSYTNHPLPDQCSLACRPRYRDPDQEIKFEKLGENEAIITFKNFQRALAPGQIVAFYENGVLLGGGTYV